MKFYKVKLQMIKERTVQTEQDISAPIDAVKFINSIENYDLSINERVIVIGLNSKNKILAYSEISSGGANSCEIDIPSIFRFLCTTTANKFIVVHNHPSGDSTPSQLDLGVTERIEKAATIMGLHFLDHIIIGDNDYTSIMSYKINKMKGDE